LKFFRLQLPPEFLEVPPWDLTGLAFPSLPDDPGEPKCTVLGTEARFSTLLPVTSADAGVELVGSESGMRSGESGREEASGLSIHLHVL